MPLHSSFSAMYTFLVHTKQAGVDGKWTGSVCNGGWLVHSTQIISASHVQPALLILELT